MNDARVRAWLDALIDRHTASFTRPELLKAIRALSARYVERRAELGRRSPLDSAGKRAAFAVFYAPLHLLATREVLAALEAPTVTRLTDLGCGTGVAGAAWSMVCQDSEGGKAPHLTGVDLDAWALREAAWNWSALGVGGRTKRGSLLAALDGQPDGRVKTGGVRPAPAPSARSGIIVAWSANELTEPERGTLLPQLLGAGERGATVIVIEPIAKSAAPWWPRWARQFEQAGGRADEWTFAAKLPRPLATLDAEAGFHRRVIKVRTLALGLGRSSD